MEPPKLRLYQLTKNIAAKIELHIFYALRDLGVIFDESILSRSPILAGEDHAGNADSFYGTKNKQINTHNNAIEEDIRIEMTVDNDKIK